MIENLCDLTMGQTVYLDDSLLGVLPYQVSAINKNYVTVHNAEKGCDRHILEFEINGVYTTSSEANFYAAQDPYHGNYYDIEAHRQSLQQ